MNERDKAEISKAFQAERSKLIATLPAQSAKLGLARIYLERLLRREQARHLFWEEDAELEKIRGNATIGHRELLDAVEQSLLCNLPSPEKPEVRRTEPLPLETNKIVSDEKKAKAGLSKSAKRRLQEKRKLLRSLEKDQEKSTPAPEKEDLVSESPGPAQVSQSPEIREKTPELEDLFEEATTLQEIEKSSRKRKALPEKPTTKKKK